MIRKNVQTEVGTLEIVLHSPTSGVVFANSDSPATVNRVQVAFRVDLGIGDKPWNQGTFGVRHFNASKVNGTDWRWVASDSMRKKIEQVARDAFDSLVSDPEVFHQVSIDKAADVLARAQSAVEQAEQALAEAQGIRQAAHEAWIDAVGDQVLAQQAAAV